MIESWLSVRGKARPNTFSGSQVLENHFDFYSFLSFLFTISNIARYALNEFPFFVFVGVIIIEVYTL